MKIAISNKDETTTRDMTPAEEAEFIKASEPTKEQKIEALKEQLADTDYIVLKIAEAVAYNDTATVTALKTEYATELANRKLWREEINNLEKE